MTADTKSDSPAAILKEQAALHDKLAKIPEIELLAEIKRMADQPAVREFVRHSLRLVEAAPPSTVGNQVVSLNNIMQGLDANLEMRMAQILAEAAEAKMAAEAADKTA